MRYLMKMYFVLIGLTFVSVSLLVSCERPANSEFATPNVEASPISKTVTMEKSDPVNDIGGLDNDDLDILGLPVKIKIVGEDLRALAVAFVAFENDDDIRNDERNIKHYDINLMQTHDRTFILFAAKLAVGEKPMLGAGTSLGRDRMYTVDRRDFTLISRNFFK